MLVLDEFLRISFHRFHQSRSFFFAVAPAGGQGIPENGEDDSLVFLFIAQMFQFDRQVILFSIELFKHLFPILRKLASLFNRPLYIQTKIKTARGRSTSRHLFFQPERKNDQNKKGFRKEQDKKQRRKKNKAETGKLNDWNVTMATSNFQSLPPLPFKQKAQRNHKKHRLPEWYSSFKQGLS